MNIKYKNHWKPKSTHSVCLYDCTSMSSKSIPTESWNEIVVHNENTSSISHIFSTTTYPISAIQQQVCWYLSIKMSVCIEFWNSLWIIFLSISREAVSQIHPFHPKIDESEIIPLHYSCLLPLQLFLLRYLLHIVYLVINSYSLINF